MVKPSLVDTNLYHKIKYKFIRNNNNILSYRFNLGIIIFILVCIIFLYYLYKQKQISKMESEESY